MDRLPDSLREVISLRALEERTYKEIADSLGKSAATAQVLYCRALQELRRQLGNETDRRS
jgi:RNA polymerase sigma factor (sigma-70 family)